MPPFDFACKNALLKEKPYRLAAGDRPYLVVPKAAPSSGNWAIASWRRKTLLSVGKYPLVARLDTREKHDEAKRPPIGISVYGLARGLLRDIVAMIARPQANRTNIAPLFLHNGDGLDIFREHGFVFER